jgi:hypothetical protein
MESSSWRRLAVLRPPHVRQLLTFHECAVTRRSVTQISKSYFLFYAGNGSLAGPIGALSITNFVVGYPTTKLCNCLNGFGVFLATA